MLFFPYVLQFHFSYSTGIKWQCSPSHSCSPFPAAPELEEGDRLVLCEIYKPLILTYPNFRQIIISLVSSKNSKKRSNQKDIRKRYRLHLVPVSFTDIFLI